MSELEPYLNARAGVLPFYAPYHFIRGLDPALQTQKLVVDSLYGFEAAENNQVIRVESGSHSHLFFVKHLPWDTAFFGRPVYKLYQVLYAHHDFKLLCQAIRTFSRNFFRTSQVYCFSEIPAEDIGLISALNAAGWRLIETRMVYYRTVADFMNERFRVKIATREDIPALRNVAGQMRNDYDRFHAEPAFSSQLADDFLAKYAEEAVQGFCDAVLIPDEPGLPSNAYLAYSWRPESQRLLGTSIFRLNLAAVSPECRGWYYKLVSEAIYRIKEVQGEYVLMDTQPTNRAVLRNIEKLQFSFGKAMHIVSYST